MLLNNGISSSFENYCRRARKTVRLHSCWNPPPTVGKADHPLVRSFSAAFESGGSGVRRESISGLTEPYWWKQKVSRWRGAATDRSEERRVGKEGGWRW